MTKLADNYYDPDDALFNRSPQLKPRQVKLEPSPPPQAHVARVVRQPIVSPPLFFFKMHIGSKMPN